MSPMWGGERVEVFVSPHSKVEPRAGAQFLIRRLALHWIQMKNLNITAFLRIFVVLTGIAWFSMAYLTSSLHDIGKMAGLAPGVVSIDCVAFFIFAKWLWRWKVLQGWL